MQVRGWPRRNMSAKTASPATTHPTMTRPPTGRPDPIKTPPSTPPRKPSAKLPPRRAGAPELVFGVRSIRDSMHDGEANAGQQGLCEDASVGSAQLLDDI